MKNVQLITSDNEQDHQALVDKYVNLDQRIAFDSVKLLTLIELIEAVHGQHAELRSAMHKLNNRMNTIIKPLHGKAMVQKRKID